MSTTRQPSSFRTPEYSSSMRQQYRERIVKSRQLKVILARLPILQARLSPSRFELHPLDCEADRTTTQPSNHPFSLNPKYYLCCQITAQLFHIWKLLSAQLQALASHHIPHFAGLGSIQLYTLIHTDSYTAGGNQISSCERVKLVVKFQLRTPDVITRQPSSFRTPEYSSLMRQQYRERIVKSRQLKVILADFYSDL